MFPSQNSGNDSGDQRGYLGLNTVTEAHDAMEYAIILTCTTFILFYIWEAQF